MPKPTGSCNFRYTIFKEMDFSAAHCLREYQGMCERIHGHNYRVRVYVSANELDMEGMVVDFAELRDAMLAVLDRFDHRFINEVAPFDEINPTLEMVAAHICEAVAVEIDSDRRRVTECHVWETDHNCAVYRR
jgi:6-pyruvoyltetrahydropterin/6-carboxytetrahydropterin synthase